MILFWIIFGIALVYFVLAFFISRLVVPFMGFGGFLLPEDVPEEIKQKIVELETKTTDQQSYVKKVYDAVLYKTLHQWNHTRFKAATRLPRAFVKDLTEIWDTKDFIYCTAINYLVFVMLTESKFFKADDIKVRHVFLNFVPHQYLQVRVGDEWIDVDPAGAGIRGFGLGHHASFFR